MAMQQFCLRWNNHQPNFISVFTTLLNNESLVDVTLAAEGRHLQAHKVVLSACSSYFQALFTVNPCQHPIVILKDVKYSDLKIIVDFMYYGEVNISQEQLSAILKTAEMLKVKGLADMGGDNLGKSQSVSSDKVELLTPGDSTWDSARQTPSPLSASAKRKRLRKSSTGSGSGSTERTSEEQLSGEITLVPSPTLVKSEPVVYATTPATDGDSGRSDSSLRNSAQEPSTDSEPREGSQDSVEDDPLGIHISQDSTTCVDTPIPDTGPGPSTSHHQQTLQASHGLQWNLLEHGYHHQNILPPSCLYAPSSPYLNSCLPNPMNPPRRRRGTNPQAEENFIRALDAVRFGGLGFCKAARIFGVNNRTLWLEYRKRGYPILRPSIRVRKQEPPDSQLQEMQQLPPTSPLGKLVKRNRPLLRQPRVKKDGESPQDDLEGLPPSPPHVLLAVPHRVERQISEPNSSLLTVPQSGSCFLVKQHSDPQGIAPTSALRQLSQPPPAFHVQLVPTMSTPDLSTRAPSPSVVVLPDHPVNESKSSPSLRVRTEELRRASSSPQECSLRSNHCPVLRPGPALGCNYCWNTIDNRGRILRRKTKYYCPECQTNLCIVPCFQSYHERVPTGSKLLPKTGSI